LGGDRGKINASASECHAAGFSNVRSKLSSQLSAGDLANLLNGLFSEFDRLALGRRRSRGHRGTASRMATEWSIHLGLPHRRRFGDVLRPDRHQLLVPPLDHDRYMRSCLMRGRRLCRRSASATPIAHRYQTSPLGDR